MSKPSARRHAASHDGSEEALDLDVTPFLNIMFMLILCILAMTSWTQLSLISVQAPRLGNTGTGVAAPEEEKSALNLTVFVLKDGFNVAATGATLDGASEGRPGQPLFPRIQKGGVTTYDFDALNKRMVEIKKVYPREQNMIISADPDVQYDDVIHTMDAARQSSDGEDLFPLVAFAAGIVG